MAVVLDAAAKAVVEAKLVDVVVGVLQSSLPPDVAEPAVDMLVAVANLQDNAVQLLEQHPGLLQVLASRLLGHSSENARVGVLHVVAALAAPPQNTPKLAQPSSLLQGLVHTLSTGTSGEKAAGAHSLSAVTSIVDVCRAVHRTPGLRASVTAAATEVAKAGPPTTAADCARVLGHVCALGDAYFVSLPDTLDQLGVVVDMLGKHASESEAASCFALAAFLAHAPLASAVATGKVVAGGRSVTHAAVSDAVFKAVDSVGAPDKQYALRCAALLAVHGDRAQAERTTTILVAQMQAEGDKGTSLSAMESLAHLLNNSHHARTALLALSTAMDTVVSLMDGGDAEYKERAVQVYAAVCVEGGPVATVPGALRSVLSLLAAPQATIQDGALTALERLSKAPGGKEALVKYPSLTQALLSRMSDPATQQRAACIVRNMKPSSVFAPSPAPSPSPSPAPGLSEEQLWEEGRVAVKADGLVLFVDCLEVGCDVKVLERKGERVDVLAEAGLDDVQTEEIIQLMHGEGGEGANDAVPAFVDAVLNHDAVVNDSALASLLPRIAECAVGVLVEDGVNEVPVAVHHAFTKAFCARIPPPAPHCTVHAVGPSQRALSELVCANDTASVRATSTVAVDVQALSLCSLEGTFEVHELTKGGRAWTAALRQRVAAFNFGTRIFCLDNFAYAVAQLQSHLEASGPDVAMTLRGFKRLCSQFLPLAEARMLLCAPQVDEFVERNEDVHTTSALFHLKQFLLHTKFREGTTICIAGEALGVSWVRGYMTTLPAPAPPSPELVRRSSMGRKRSSGAPANGNARAAPPAKGPLAKRKAAKQQQKSRLNVEGNEQEWTQALRGLLRNANTPERRQQAIATASAFASHPDIAAKVVEGIGLEAFEEASQSSDAEVRYGCVGLLHCYVAADAAATVHAPDAVLNILAQVLSQPQEDKVVVEALESVLELLSRDATRGNVHKHNTALPACIGCMSSESKSKSEAACEVVASAVDGMPIPLLAPHAVLLVAACCDVLTREPPLPSCTDFAATCLQHAIAAHPNPSPSTKLPAALTCLLQPDTSAEAKHSALEAAKGVLGGGGSWGQSLVAGDTHASLLCLLEENSILSADIALALEVLERFGGDGDLKEDLGAVVQVWERIGHVMKVAPAQAKAHALRVGTIAASSLASRAIVAQLFSDPSPNSPMATVMQGVVGVLRDASHPARDAALELLLVLSTDHPKSRAAIGSEPVVRDAVAAQLRAGGRAAEMAGSVLMQLSSAPENQGVLATTASILDSLPALANASSLGGELAAGSVALLTHSEDTHRPIGVHNDVVAMLVRLGEARDPECAKASDFALRAIANLLVNEDNQIDLFQRADLLGVLTRAASQPSTTTQEASATALTFLVGNPHNQDAMVQCPDVVQALVVLAKSGSHSAQEDAVVGLGAICEKPAIQESIAQQEGAIAAVLRMMVSEEPTISVAASWLLANLAKSEVNQILISDEEDTFDVLAACIDSELDDALRENCIVAVAHLTRDHDNQLMVSQHEPLMVAVMGVLHHPLNDTATYHALLVLCHVCSARANSLAFLQLPGSIDVLVGLMHSQVPMQQECAGRVMMLLAKDNEARPLLIQAPGFLDGLAALINSHRPKAVDVAHRTILYIMPDRNSIRVVAAHPGVVGALQGTDQATKLTPKLKSGSKDLLARIGVPPKLLVASRRQSARR